MIVGGFEVSRIGQRSGGGIDSCRSGVRIPLRALGHYVWDRAGRVKSLDPAKQKCHRAVS